jgi:hypothetical protein
MALNWKIFTQRPYIASLSLEEQVRLFRIANEKSIRLRESKFQDFANSNSTSQGAAGDGDTGVTPYASTYSLSFDGTDDQVNLDSTVDLNDLSISIWAKPGDIGNGSDGLFLGLRTSNSNKIEINNVNTTSFKTNGSNLTRSGTPVLVDDQWQHFFITRISNTLQWYLNGSTWGSSATKTGNLEFDCIGYMNNGGKTWLGELDDIAVWNTDQTANIATIYNGGVPGDLSSLSPLHWWKFNEGSGTTAVDSGTGGNNGTIVGPVYSTDVPT